MISDKYVLPNILVACESTLRLEYKEDNINDVGRILKEAKQRLENAYHEKMDEGVYTTQAKNALVANDLETFVDSAAKCVEQLATLSAHTFYTKRAPVKLADVNYLGFAREALCQELRYLQDKVAFERGRSEIPTLKSALNNVEMSDIKRLFLVMLAFDNLGMPEGVYVCAQLLYHGR